MLSKALHRLVISLAGIIFLSASVTVSYGETVIYSYDPVNRLKRVENGSGVVVECFYDGAGNRTSVELPDTVPPTTTATPPGGLYNSSRSVTLTCSDGQGSGCANTYYTTDGTNPTASSAVYSSPLNIGAMTTLKFFAKDVSGNSETVKTEIYVKDTTPPTGTVTVNSGASYTNTCDVTVTLACTDANGCSQMRLSNDNATYSSPETYVGTKAWTLTTGDGYKHVYAKFRDGANNWSGGFPSTIMLDTVRPTGTISINSGAAYTYRTSVTLSLTCTDGHACSKMRFSNDGVTYSQPEDKSSTKYWTLATGDGPKAVYVQLMDLANNWSAAYSSTIQLETVAPSTTASPAGGSYGQPQSVTLTCDDGTGSGCDKIHYTTNGSTPTTSSPVYSSPISIATTTTVKFFAKDKAGNSEPVKSQTYQF